MNRLASSFFFLAVVSALACSVDSGPSSPSSPGGKSDSPNDDGVDANNTLVIAGAAAIQFLDPAAARAGTDDSVARYAYEAAYTLSSAEQALEVGTDRRGLVANETMLASGGWELQVRSGIVFHDGSPLDAETLKCNYERVFEMEPFVPGGGFAALIAEVGSIDVLDPITLRINTADGQGNPVDFPFLRENLARILLVSRPRCEASRALIALAADPANPTQAEIDAYLLFNSSLFSTSAGTAAYQITPAPTTCQAIDGQVPNFV